MQFHSSVFELVRPRNLCHTSQTDRHFANILKSCSGHAKVNKSIKNWNLDTFFLYCILKKIMTNLKIFPKVHNWIKQIRMNMENFCQKLSWKKHILIINYCIYDFIQKVIFYLAMNLWWEYKKQPLLMQRKNTLLFLSIKVKY